MHVDSPRSTSLHPALVAGAQTAERITTLAQRAYYDNSRAAVSQLAAHIIARETDLQRVNANISSFKENPTNAPQLKELGDVRKEIGLLESRLDNERQKAGGAEGMMKQSADQVRLLRDKIERSKSGMEAIRSQMAETLGARGIRNLQQPSVATGPGPSSEIGSATSGPGRGASLPSSVEYATALESTQRIDELTRKLNELSMEAANLRKEAADIKKESEDKQKTQQINETRRRKALQPARVNNEQLLVQYQTELNEICLHWGLQPPTSVDARKGFYDKILDRVTEYVPGSTQPLADHGRAAGSCKGQPHVGNPAQRHFKAEIIDEEFGALKAFTLLNAYIHPVKVDTSVQEEMMSISLGLAKQFIDTPSIRNKESAAADTITMCSELALEISQGRLKTLEDELAQNDVSQTYKFRGTNLKKKQRDALGLKYGQLAGLVERHLEHLTSDMKAHNAELLGKQVDIGDLQARLRINTKAEVLKLQADLLENEVRQNANQAARNTVLAELVPLRKELGAAMSDPQSSRVSGKTDVAPEVSLMPVDTPVLQPEVRLSASVGKLQILEEELAVRVQEHETAQAQYRTAENIVRDTRQTLEEKHIRREQLQKEVTEGSAEFRQLLAQRARLNEHLNIEIKRIKKDPAITKLLSETALALVLARHVDKTDSDLIDRSYIVGRSGTYASFSAFLQALVEVHQDASERFSDMMHAPSRSDFDAARQRRQDGSEKLRDVTFQHAKPVGWSFHADGRKHDTPIQSNTSTYSIDWFGQAGPLISHIYPSTRDQ